MKVAYMFGGMNRGGAETLLLDVFRNWRKAPFSFIGIHRKSGAYQEDFYTAGPVLYQLAPRRLGYMRYLLQLRKILKNEGITIVHTQHWLDCIYAYLATIGINVCIINTFHGYSVVSGIKGIPRRLSIRLADDVCFVSGYELQWFKQQMKIHDSKCHILYNAIDFSKLDMAKANDEICVSTGRIRLAMVGNFVTVRDHRTIMRALLILSERGVTNFDFYFIGKRVDDEAYLYDECVRISEENKMNHTHFLGARGDVPSLLKAMDGFVYCTDHDTFGIAVVEAIAAALPVVVNDHPVMQEVCGAPNAGVRYFRTNDADDAAVQIADMITNIQQSKQDAQMNADRIRERYSIQTHIDNAYHIYLSL